MPDIIAHRGFSAENPENTLISYTNAVIAGTTALEGGKKKIKEKEGYVTLLICLIPDIRLSKDNEIVVMHDLTLDRTSTGKGPVRESNWHGYIDGLTTKAEPSQAIPRFKDVLDLLTQPEVSSIEGLYMIVDIKVTNNKNEAVTGGVSH